MKRLFHFLYIVYAYTLFVVGLLIIFPGVLIGVLFGQPFGGNLVIKLCMIWSDCWLFVIGIRNKRITLEPTDPKKHYVFVANHVSYLDIPIIFQSVRKNHIRILGKVEMSKIPVFGTLYKLVVVMVDRSSNTNRAKSMEVLKEVLNQNISILIFPEGTFNESGKPLKNFYDGAFRIAIETNTPVKPLVYLDTIDRMHFSSAFSLKPGISRVVILPEINAAGLTIEDLPVFKKQVFDQMEAAYIKYKYGVIDMPVKEN